MVKYELVLVLPGNSEKEKLLTITAKLQKIISSLGGKILKEDDWGVKRMSYPIKKNYLGSYSFWTLSLNKDKFKELNRLLNFETELLRYMLLKIPHQGLSN